MLAISVSDYLKYGCPSCGCDVGIKGNISDGCTEFSTCESCHLEFILLADGLTVSTFGIRTKNDTETEYPVLIEHPRKRVGPKWAYIWPDIKPADVEGGEYFSPRGVGYDLAGFVKSRQAGERIIEMAKRVLGKDEIKSWLDYRPREPKWIQVKFQPGEFNLEKLDQETQGGIITEEILRNCLLNEE